MSCEMPAGSSGVEIWQPAIEVEEQPGKPKITADVLGQKKEDIKVSVADNVLAFEGQRKQEKEEKREG